MRQTMKLPDYLAQEALDIGAADDALERLLISISHRRESFWARVRAACLIPPSAPIEYRRDSQEVSWDHADTPEVTHGP